MECEVGEKMSFIQAEIEYCRKNGGSGPGGQLAPELRFLLKFLRRCRSPRLEQGRLALEPTEV